MRDSSAVAVPLWVSCEGLMKFVWGITALFNISLHIDKSRVMRGRNIFSEMLR